MFVILQIEGNVTTFKAKPEKQPWVSHDTTECNSPGAASFDVRGSTFGHQDQLGEGNRLYF